MNSIKKSFLLSALVTQLNGMHSTAICFREADKQFIDKNDQVVEKLPERGRVLIVQTGNAPFSPDHGDKDILGWIYENGTLKSFANCRHNVTHDGFLHFIYSQYNSERDHYLLKLKIMQSVNSSNTPNEKTKLQQKYPVAQKFDQEFHIRNSNAANSFIKNTGLASDLD